MMLIVCGQRTVNLELSLVSTLGCTYNSAGFDLSTYKNVTSDFVYLNVEWSV